MPVGENTPLMRGSREPKISSCASSGNVPASHDIALKIVATHEDDGQPRATCARTSHCVWKSTSSPPYLRGAVMRNTPASASASNCSGRTRLACSVATAFSARRGTSARVRATTGCGRDTTDLSLERAGYSGSYIASKVAADTA